MLNWVIKMFFLIGSGLNSRHLTLEAIDALKNCGKVFFEGYTSRLADGNIGELEKIVGKKFVLVDRAFVEEKFEEVLAEAKRIDVGLCVVGNPLFATTHLQLLLDAKKLGVKFRVIEGLSIHSFVSETGLDAYKFGRICSIVSWENGFEPDSFFNFVEKNFSIGLHSLCLLDIKTEKNFFLSIKKALEILLEVEKRKKKNLLRKCVLVGLAGIGSKRQLIKAGELKDLLNFPEEPSPQCLIVCGKLCEKEKDALRELSDFGINNKKKEINNKKKGNS